MTTPNEANEAKPWAVAQSGPRPAQGDVDELAVLAQDKRAARELAKAKAFAIKAGAKAAAHDTAQHGEAERQRLAQDREAERQAAQARDKAERKREKAERDREKADRRAAQWAASRGKAAAALRALWMWAVGLVRQVQAHSANSFTAFVYAGVLTVAVGSQYLLFERILREEPSLKTFAAVSEIAALPVALFIEIFGLAFYTTSVASRLEGRSGWLPRLAAWAVTVFASFLQYQAHKEMLIAGEPLISYATAAVSLGTMLLAEVRTTHLVGKRLEEMDQKDRPQARLGVRFWLRYTRQAWWALSAMIAMPTVRTRTQALRAGRLMAKAHHRAKLSTQLKAEAQRSLRAAQRDREAASAVLAGLAQLIEADPQGIRDRVGPLALAASRSKAASEAAMRQLELVAHHGLTAYARVEAAAQAPVIAAVGQPRQLKAAAHSTAQEPEAAASGPDEAAPEPQAAVSAVNEAEVEARPPFDDFIAEVWAERPKGCAAWAARVAELGRVYPAELPPRASVIENMKLLDLDPDRKLDHSWTNKGYVGQAMRDLRELRDNGYGDDLQSRYPARAVALNPGE